MTSVIAISPKEGSADDVKQLIVDSRADGVFTTYLSQTV